MASAKERLLAATIPVETVAVPELEMSFTVRGMTGTERDAFESSLVVLSANGKRRSFSSANIRAKLLVHSLIDPDTRQRLFTEAEAEQLGTVPAAILDRLFSVAQRLSGIRDQDVEDLAKKSGPASSPDSPTN